VKIERDIYVGDELVGQLVFQSTQDTHSRFSKADVEANTVISNAARLASRGFSDVPELRRPDPPQPAS
jgi:hypothetical protein